MPELIAGLDGVDMFAYLGEIVRWMGIVGASLLVLAVLWFIWYFFRHTIKVKIVKLYGSSTDGQFSFGRETNNKIRWVQNGTAWKTMWPLFSRKTREPIDQEYIYPGNVVYVFEFEDEWIPGRRNINVSEGKMRAEINPIPYYLRNWASLQEKKLDLEYAQHDFWSDNKMLIIALIFSMGCLAACCLTVYWSYRYATGGMLAMEKLTEALQNVQNLR